MKPQTFCFSGEAPELVGAPNASGESKTGGAPNNSDPADQRDWLTRDATP